MPVGVKRYVKNRFDVCHRPAHVQNHPVGMRPGHRQAVCLRESNDGLIILYRRAELFRELFRRQIVMKLRAGRVVDLAEQIVQGRLIAER